MTPDLARVREFLQRDCAWSAFALADLHPPYAQHCSWYLAPDALLLIYRGFQPPLLFAAGATGSTLQLLSDAGDQPEFYVSLRDGMLGHLAASGWRVFDAKSLYRMVLVTADLPAVPRTERLGPRDFSAVDTLFSDGDASGERPPFFQSEALEHGVYFGVREGGELVAAAGTLVFAPAESVSCIGNVYTRRDCRGRGLASRVTAAVSAELIGLGITTVALNVRCDNRAALRIYERLGFTRYCEYEEARIERV